MTDHEQGVPPAASPGSDVDAVSGAALLDRMTDAFFAVDDEWRFTYLNESGRDVIREAAEGSVADDLVGVNIWEAIPDIVDTVFHERYREAMRTQEPAEFTEYYGPLDIWFDVRAYPSESGLSVFFRDVTAERERLTELEEREETLRAITEAIADIDHSFEERVRRLLEIGAGMLDVEYGTLSRIRDDRYVFEVVYAPDDLIVEGDAVDLSETHCERVVISEQKLALRDIEAEASDPAERDGTAGLGIECYIGVPVMVEGEVYGTFCFYDLRPRTEPFDDSRVALVELMAEWVSSALERRVVEEDLRRQNARLEEFAGIVSHDLRNPLAVAKGETELAAEAHDSEHLEKARSAHGRMDRIISDMLTMARLEAEVDATERVDLSTVAAEAWSTVDTADATLDADDAPAVVAGRSRLVQLLENLFRNAVEHAGDDVHVDVEAISGGFAVADDGPGIPDSDRESVFDHGHTDSPDGTGFGLSIVRRIAEAHGWEVRVADTDAGARFEFTGVDPA